MLMLKNYLNFKCSEPQETQLVLWFVLYPCHKIIVMHTVLFPKKNGINCCNFWTGRPIWVIPFGKL